MSTNAAEIQALKAVVARLENDKDATSADIAKTENSQTHRFEHSSSWKKPSSESHQWSYDGACNNCLAEVERRHGVDWKVTDVEFEDKGRTTKSSTSSTGKRTWRCTHTVVAKYNIVHRGRELSERSEFVPRTLVIKYRMQNPFFEGAPGSGKTEAEEFEELTQTHRFEHSSSWKKPSSESHQWSYDGACNNCLAEVERRHGVDWKVTDVEFEDKGRTTKGSTSLTGKRTWRCTHTVVAKYNIVHRGRELSESNAEYVTSQLQITYNMRNPNWVESEGQSVRESKSIPPDAAMLQGSKQRESGIKFSPELQQRRIDALRKLGLMPARAKKAIPASELNEPSDETSSAPPIESFFFPVPEIVCFPDERDRVRDTTILPYSAACQLVIHLPGGRQARGTGWLMGPRLVVTAGHCVHEGKDGSFFESIEVIPAMNGAERPFGAQTAGRASLRASNAWKTSGTLAGDYGAILLDRPFASASGSSPGAIEAVVRTDGELNGAVLELSGYPGDKNFGEQWADQDPVSAVEAGRLQYYLDTYGGQSGSGVRTVSDNKVVGIHNYGGCPNKCTRISAAVKVDLDGWLAESEQ
jgi:glutamyl endopeptidase